MNKIILFIAMSLSLLIFNANAVVVQDTPNVANVALEQGNSYIGVRAVVAKQADDYIQDDWLIAFQDDSKEDVNYFVLAKTKMPENPNTKVLALGFNARANIMV